MVLNYNTLCVCVCLVSVKTRPWPIARSEIVFILIPTSDVLTEGEGKKLI